MQHERAPSDHPSSSWKKVPATGGVCRQVKAQSSLVNYKQKGCNIHQCSHLPTMASSTELLPDDCEPTTTICGSCSGDLCPTAPKTSCRFAITGISCSMVDYLLLFAEIGFVVLCVV